MKLFDYNVFCVVALAATAFSSVSVSAAPPTETVYVTGPRSSQIDLQRTDQGQIFLTMKVGGKDLDFILDTGAPNTIIDAVLAKELGIVGDPASERLSAMGGSIISDVSARTDIVLGDLLIHRCPVRIMDLKDMRATVRKLGFRDFHGFVGLDMLMFLRGRLDFDKMSLAVRRP